MGRVLNESGSLLKINIGGLVCDASRFVRTPVVMARTQAVKMRACSETRNLCSKLCVHVTRGFFCNVTRIPICHFVTALRAFLSPHSPPHPCPKKHKTCTRAPTTTYNLEWSKTNRDLPV